MSARVAAGRGAGRPTWLKGEKTSRATFSPPPPDARLPAERMPGEGEDMRAAGCLSGETSCGSIARPPGEARTSTPRNLPAWSVRRESRCHA